jgi:hypothetical protein
VNGAYTLTVNETDGAGNAASPTLRSFTVDTVAPALSLAAPSTLTAPAVVTASERVSGLAASAVTLSVTGTTTKLATTLSCLNGTTAVACSGTYTALRVTPRSPLLPGQHYTLALAAGATHDLAGNASPGTSLAFRALRSVQETTPSAGYAWANVTSSSAWGGSYRTEHLAGATARWTFTGTSIRWWTVTGPTQGRAYLLVDGVRKLSADNYAAATHYHVARTVTGLRYARHTVTVQVLGLLGSTTGKGTFVAVDAFSVGTLLTKTPALVMTWRRAASRSFSAGYAAVADRAGCTLGFAFRGTSVTWYTERARSMGQVAVYLDGVYKGTVDNYATSTTYAVARALTRLSDRVHTLKLVVLGRHHRGATGTSVIVDRFGVG